MFIVTYMTTGVTDDICDGASPSMCESCECARKRPIMHQPRVAEIVDSDTFKEYFHANFERLSELTERFGIFYSLRFDNTFPLRVTSLLAEAEVSQYHHDKDVISASVTTTVGCNPMDTTMSCDFLLQITKKEDPLSNEDKVCTFMWIMSHSLITEWVMTSTDDHIVIRVPKDHPPLDGEIFGERIEESSVEAA